jgi:hypothetical protein
MIMLYPPKRRGRPRLDPTDSRPSEPVNLTLAASDYEVAKARASYYRESLQDLIRRTLQRELQDKSRGKRGSSRI